jgi:diguanylate cyclase (GGDEF)-like protein
METVGVQKARPGRALASAWRVTIVLGLLLLAAHFGFGAWGHGVDDLFNNWIYDLVEALAAAGVLARAALVREERWAWLWMGVALAAMTGGDVIFDHVYGGNPPFPSYADALYIGFYPACYVSIGLILRSRISRFSASVWLDGVMAAAAAAAVAAAVLVQVVVDSTHGSQLVVLTNLAYPLLDVLLLAAVVFVFSVTRWRPGRAWSLFAAGLLVNSIGDGVFLYQTAMNTYTEGTLVDLAWPTSLALLGFAAWLAPGKARSQALEQRALFGTPIACGVVAVGVFVAGAAGGVHPIAVAFASATVLLILVRTALMFRENRTLLEQSRVEAQTDALTGLANRRKLVADLERELREARENAPRLLAIFDLNGFKRYNDTFGHPAGDALLARLATKLEAAVAPDGGAYRMGGDEFCVLIPASEPLLARATNALADHGESFSVTSSYGAVVLPKEAATASDALRTADERLYRQKEMLPANRGAAYEPLLRTLAEREPGLREHVEDVSMLAREMGRRLGLDPIELEDLKLAAELHDVGKLAIPDSILQKPGPLDASEWVFMHQHTVIGQRILTGAPALATVGTIVRSTHERWDGTGYPDGLAGEDILLAARIIAVCDAFSAITSERPYAAASTPEQAVAELRRCAGTQFDPKLVELLCVVLDERGRATADLIALAG